MTRSTRQVHLATAAVAAALSGFVAAPIVEHVGAARIGAPAAAVLAGVGMWSVLLVHVAFTVAQLLPGGREPVTGVPALPGDAWLLALVCTMMPSGAWRALAAHAPVPLGLDWLPGWPLYVGVLLVLARVVHLNLYEYARRGRPDAATR
jgi:hypothetical protein